MVSKQACKASKRGGGEVWGGAVWGGGGGSGGGLGLGGGGGGSEFANAMRTMMGLEGPEWYMVLTCLKASLHSWTAGPVSPDQGNAGPFDQDRRIREPEDHRTRGQARPKKREKTEPDLGKNNTGPRLEP